MSEDMISNLPAPIPMLLKSLSPITSPIKEMSPSRPDIISLTLMEKTLIIDSGPGKVLCSPKEEPKT